MDEQEVAASDLAFEEQMRIDQSRKEAQMLSEASADALNSMGASMMGNDAGTLDELHTLSDSFRRLSSALYDLYSHDKPAADPPQQLGEAEPISPPQEPPIQAAFVQSRHVEPASTAAFVSGPQESQEPAMDEEEVAASDLAFEEQMRIDQSRKEAQMLSEASAHALNSMSASMMGNDAGTLDELHTLSDSFRRLSSAEYDLYSHDKPAADPPQQLGEAEPISPPQEPPIQAAFVQSKHVEPASTAAFVSGPQESQEPAMDEQEVAASDLAFEEQIRIDQSRKEAQMLSEASADALNSMGASMMGNDAGALDELHTLSDSFRRLSSAEYDLLSQDKPAANPPQQLGEAMPEPISPPPDEPYLQAAFVPSGFVEPASTSAFISSPQGSEEPVMDVLADGAAEVAFEEVVDKPDHDLGLSGDLSWQHVQDKAHSLAEESSRALDRVTDAMVSNDAKTLEELQSLSFSLKNLASDENNFWSSFAKAGDSAQDSGDAGDHADVADMNLDIISVPNSSDPEADFSLDLPPVVTVNPYMDVDSHSLEQAVSLAEESTKAIGILSASMVENDDSILDELQTLSDGFKKLASDNCDFLGLFGGSGTGSGVVSSEAATSDGPSDADNDTVPTEAFLDSNAPMLEQVASVTPPRSRSELSDRSGGGRETSEFALTAHDGADSILDSSEVPTTEFDMNGGTFDESKAETTAEFVPGTSTWLSESTKYSSSLSANRDLQETPVKQTRPTPRKYSKPVSDALKEMSDTLTQGLARRLASLTELSEGFKDLVKISEGSHAPEDVTQEEKGSVIQKDDSVASSGSVPRGAGTGPALYRNYAKWKGPAGMKPPPVRMLKEGTLAKASGLVNGQFDTPPANTDDTRQAAEKLPEGQRTLAPDLAHVLDGSADLADATLQAQDDPASPSKENSYLSIYDQIINQLVEGLPPEQRTAAIYNAYIRDRDAFEKLAKMRREGKLPLEQNSKDIDVPPYVQGTGFNPFERTGGTLKSSVAISALGISAIVALTALKAGNTTAGL
eukprot:Sro19_g013420.1 n/a (1022) ;mRNA; r:64486-67551